jgi:hypothetical protein
MGLLTCADCEKIVEECNCCGEIHHSCNTEAKDMTDEFICVDCESEYILETVHILVNADKITIEDAPNDSVFCGSCKSSNVIYKHELEEE